MLIARNSSEEMIEQEGVKWRGELKDSRGLMGEEQITKRHFKNHMETYCGNS